MAKEETQSLVLVKRSWKKFLMEEIPYRHQSPIVILFTMEKIFIQDEKKSQKYSDLWMEIIWVMDH